MFKKVRGFNVFIFLCRVGIMCTMDYDVSLYNVDCGPYPEVVKTDESGSYQYIPLYLKLHRCQGKDIDDNPFGKICSPIEKHLITFLVDREGSMYKKNFENHTACKYVCKKDSLSCTAGQSWNEDICSCCEDIVACEKNFKWDETTCSCVCPNTSKNNCGMEQLEIEDGVSFLNKAVGMKYVWTIAAAEGLLLVTICFFVFYYFCRGRQCKSRMYHKSSFKPGTDKRNSDSISEASFSKQITPFTNCEGNYDGEFCERERFLSF